MYNSVPAPGNFAPASAPGNYATTSAPRNAASNALVSQVELSVSARTLVDRDLLSKSDPVCILQAVDPRTGNATEIGRTEQVRNNLNPVWNTKFTVDYRFEERQLFRFSIYDWDVNTHSVSGQEFLGSMDCSLGEIVASAGQKFERNLILPQQYRLKTSTISIVAIELSGNKEVVHMKVNGRKLDKKDFLGKSDPYIVISKLMDDRSYSQVHKTEVIKNTLNPEWKPFMLRVASLTFGKPDRKLRFQVFDWDNDNSSDLIGEFETSYVELTNAFKENRASFPLINNAKKEKKKKSYTNSGLLNVEWLRVEEEKSFLDHIQNGVQLHFTVAVDFTASNGDPSNPQSLHYRNPNSDNQYVMAIKSVGEIIQDYDSDKSFPALGFGGRVPPTGAVSHEFILNGNPQNPFCQGVQGILDAYFHSLNTVQLYGPTYFAPVIRHVSRFASSYQDGKNYFILLIITDGIICDMDQTKEAIIAASSLPMSIIIVGVGAEDFSAMEFLDSDGKLLSHNGRYASRDIVQFVEMRKFYGQGPPMGQYPPTAYGQQQHTASYIQRTNYTSKAELARAVLAELPDQLVLWMKKLKPVV